MKKVEKQLSHEMPSSFGIMIDGWSEMATTTHLIGVFAVYTARGERKLPLQGFAPLLDETSLNADNHIEFIIFVLEVYKKSLNDV